MQDNLIEVNSNREQTHNKEQMHTFTKRTVLTYLAIYIITCISIILCNNHLANQIYNFDYWAYNIEMGQLFWVSFAIVLSSQFYFQFNYILRNKSIKQCANYFISIIFLIFIGPFSTGFWSTINLDLFETTYIHLIQIFIVSLVFTYQICNNKQINTQNNWYFVIIIPSTLNLFCDLLQQYLYQSDISYNLFYYPSTLANVVITLYCTILLHMILNLQRKQEITNDEIIVSACQLVGIPLQILTYLVYIIQKCKNQLQGNQINQKYLRKVIFVYAFSSFVIIIVIQFPVFFILFRVYSIFDYLIGVEFYVRYPILLKPQFWISFSIYIISYPLQICLKSKVNEFFKWMLYIMYVISYGFTLLGLILYFDWMVELHQYSASLQHLYGALRYLLYASIFGIVVGLLTYIMQDLKEIRFKHLFLCLALNYAFIYIHILTLNQIQNLGWLFTLCVIGWIMIFMIYNIYIIWELKQQCKQEEEYLIGSMMLAQPIQTILYRWIRR